MQVWAHARGIYVPQSTKESACRSPIYQLLHRLVVFTICHKEKCDKVPSGDLFYMWCPTQMEVHLYLPFALVLYLSGMALGTTSQSRICGGHCVTILALSYGVDTSGMVPISIQFLGTTTLGKMRVLTREFGAALDDTRG